MGAVRERAERGEVQMLVGARRGGLLLLLKGGSWVRELLLLLPCAGGGKRRGRGWHVGFVGRVREGELEGYVLSGSAPIHIPIESFQKSAFRIYSFWIWAAVKKLHDLQPPVAAKKTYGKRG